MLKKKGKSWRKKKGEDSFTLKAKVEANEEVYSSDRSESNQNSKSESNVNSRSEGKTNDSEWALYKEDDGVLKYKMKTRSLSEESDELEEVHVPSNDTVPSEQSTELAEHLSRISALEEENRHLETQLQNTQSLLDSVKQAADADKSRLEKDVNDALEKAEVLRGERDGLKVKIKSLKDTLNTMRQQVDMLIASNAGGKVKSDNESIALQDQLADLRKDHTIVKAKCAELTTQCASLSRVSAFWESRATVLEESKKALELEVSSIQRERQDGIRQQLEQAEHKVNALHQEYTKELITIQHDSTQDKLEQTKRQEVQRRIETKVHSFIALYRDHSKLKKEKDSLQLELNSLNSKAQDSQNTQVRKLQTRVDELVAETSSLKAKSKQLELDKSSLQATSLKLKSENTKLKNKNTSLINENESIVAEQNAKLAAAIERSKKEENSSSGLELQLLQLKNENQGLRVDLAKAKKTNDIEQAVKQAVAKARDEFEVEKEKEIAEILASQKAIMENLVIAVRSEEQLKQNVKSQK